MFIVCLVVKPEINKIPIKINSISQVETLSTQPVRSFIAKEARRSN